VIKFVKLGDACLVRRGTTITRKQTKKGDVPVIAGGRKATYFHNKHNRESGTITVSGSGASAGLVNYWSIPIFASDCSTVELKDNKQNAKFIYYYMQSMQEFIYKDMRSGAAQPHVYAKDIASLNFPLFSLEEQQRIVDKLEAAFAEIDNSVLIKKSKITNLKTIEKKITNKLILKHGSDFIKRPLHTLFNLSSGKFLPRKKMNLNGKIKVYGGNGISGYHDSFNLENVNILIGRVGAYCGNVYYTNEKIWITDNCLHINSYKYDFDKQFLSMLLSSLNLRAYAHQTAQPAISYSSLKDMELTFPKSIQEQTIIFKSYTDLKNNLKNLNNIYENQMISLKKLKLSVLNKEILNEVA